MYLHISHDDNGNGEVVIFTHSRPPSLFFPVALLASMLNGKETGAINAQTIARIDYP